MEWKTLLFCIVTKWFEAICKVSLSFWCHKIETKKLFLEPKIKTRRKNKKNANLHKFWISLLSNSDPCKHAFSKDWIPSCYLLHVLMHGHYCKILIFSSLVYDPSFGRWCYFCLWVIIFFIGKLVWNLDLENTISTWTRDFSLKKWPKFAIFQRKKLGKHWNFW